MKKLWKNLMYGAFALAIVLMGGRAYAQGFEVYSIDVKRTDGTFYTLDNLTIANAKAAMPRQVYARFLASEERVKEHVDRADMDFPAGGSLIPVSDRLARAIDDMSTKLKGPGGVIIQLADVIERIKLNVDDNEAGPARYREAGYHDAWLRQ